MSHVLPFYTVLSGYFHALTYVEGCYRKKALSVSVKKELVIYAKEQHKLSSRAVCKSLDLSCRSSYYYEKLETQNTVETDLLGLSLKHKRYGYRKLYIVRLCQYQN